MKSKKQIFKVFFLTLLLWLLGHVIYTISDGLTDENLRADIAVILGNTVKKDGTLSERLKKRMECGLQLYRTGRVKKILVSGGLGKEGHFEG
ncbi:MAG: YdcF family protein, partial [Bacteroidia bacterium]|nr:YdcF family protein [Bacteroidia bacterium]